MAPNRLIGGYTSSILISGIVHAIPLTFMIVNYDRLACPSPVSLTIEVNWQQSAPPFLPPQSFKTTKVAPPTDTDSRVSTHTSPRPAEKQKSFLSSIPRPEIKEDENLTFTNRKPNYPEEARLLGIEGTVMVKLAINPEGTIHEAQALNPKAHPILEQSALAQIKGWRFTSSSSRHSITIPIKFELEE
ncbi:MAG: TonB family protein [Candidatus Paracaedibacteraceae bacterium]|nr:TonB family protein [Candidatus Paracaedibacteraceae bacterium]